MKIIYAVLYFYFFITAHGITHCDMQRPIAITVWVHGSFVGPDFIFHDFFFRHMGMVKATDYASRYHSRDMASALCKAAPEQYQMEHFYFWGWSGKLSSRARKHESAQLYDDLIKLLAHYHHIYPEQKVYLRLISHSHGGNVLLNLAHVENPDQLLIDELILLSCPVQYATKDLITADCFKKLYAFYSADLYQVIDFQRTIKNGRLIKRHSERRFREIPKVHQAKIKINGRALLHVEFMLDKFIRHIPRLCAELDEFYNALPEKDQTREKLLHLQTARNKITVRRKLF